MRVGVIGGGGSHGAYTAGRLVVSKPDYDVIFAASTGALIGLLAISGKWEALEEAYSTIRAKDIFNVNPFKKDGKIKILHSIRRIIAGHKTIGETEALLKTINRYYTIDDHKRIRREGKELIISVTDLNKRGNPAVLISSKNTTYGEFTKYVLASTCVPVVCSIVTTADGEFVDGGITESLSLKEAKKLNPKRTDCFIHRYKESGLKDSVKNVFHLAARTIGIMKDAIDHDDMDVDLEGLNKYYLPEKPSFHPLVFDERMKDMVEQGKKNPI